MEKQGLKDAEALLQFEDFTPSSSAPPAAPPPYEQTHNFSKFPTSQVDIDIEDDEVRVPPKKFRKSVPSHPVAILSPELTEPVPTVKVWAALIIDKKKTSTLVKELSEMRPIFNHLKRVKSHQGSLKILVDLANGSPEVCFEELMKGGMNVEGLSHYSEWEAVQVPQRPPSSRSQYETAVRQWPCNFHEDPSLEKLLNRAWFSADVLEQKARFMEISRTISLSPENVTWTCDNGKGLESLTCHEEIDGIENACIGPTGVVVVNPLKNAIVAAASIKREVHPLKHSVMVAIDLVASSQGGGVWVQSKSESKEPGSYLCTDYEFYITHEPCIMCCMALLHSRAKCVFFCRKANGGGLISSVRLHTLPGINHRYQEKPMVSDEAQKSGPSFWSFGYYQRFFDVDTPQVKERLMWSFLPRPSQDVLTSYIRPTPDLYGPFWICVTLVFCIAIMGNIADYLQSGGQGQHWVYDFRKVSISASTIFSYALLLPLLLWLSLWWRRKQGEQIQLAFMEIVCLYGYSLAIYIPVSILWTIPVSWLQWILVIAGAALSGSVLVLALWTPLSGNRRGLAAVILVAVFFCHLLLAAGLQLYFFRYDNAINSGTLTGTADPPAGVKSPPTPAALNQVLDHHVPSSLNVTDPILTDRRSSETGVVAKAPTNPSAGPESIKSTTKKAPAVQTRVKNPEMNQTTVESKIDPPAAKATAKQPTR